MADRRDPFGKLTGDEAGPDSARQQSRKRRRTDLLDQLAYSADERRVLGWLRERGQAAHSELASAFPDMADLGGILNSLGALGELKSALVNGVRVLTLERSAAKRATTTSLTQDFWSRINTSRSEFLKQVPIFRGLSDEQAQIVYDLFEPCRFQVGHQREIIVQQGKPDDAVYIIKSGIVALEKISMHSREAQIVAYLKQGDLLGEVNALRDSMMASTTARARTTVDALRIGREVFIDLLYRYPSIAVDLSRAVAQRLVATERRASHATTARLSLLVECGNADVTPLGLALAAAFQQADQRATVYTELPDPDSLPERVGAKGADGVIPHTAGFDIITANRYAGFAPMLRAKLALEDLCTRHERLVIGIEAHTRDVLIELVPEADQIVFVAPPDSAAWDIVHEAQVAVRKHINPESVNLFTVCARSNMAHSGQTPPAPVDFDLPYSAAWPALSALTLDTVPPDVADMVRALADRLGRTNQISIFIPTTIDVNQAVDTAAYVDRTLAFLGERFGGATTTQARGVWNSAEAGLVGETIHIVRSYATQHDLDTHLQGILDYVGALKVELRQEAMAVEINQQLMLI